MIFFLRISGFHSWKQFLQPPLDEKILDRNRGHPIFSHIQPTRFFSLFWSSRARAHTGDVIGKLNIDIEIIRARKKKDWGKERDRKKQEERERNIHIYRFTYIVLIEISTNLYRDIERNKNCQLKVLHETWIKFKKKGHRKFFLRKNYLFSSVSEIYLHILQVIKPISHV